MIDEELLISYLQEQKRQYQEQMIILYRELNIFLTTNNEEEYIVTAMCESIANIIQVYTDLIEMIKNREFDVEVANSLSTDTIPVNYGFNQAEKSIKPLNNIISSVTEGEYNEDFINEMKRIEKEKSEKLK